MERPYYSRSIISNDDGHLDISIPIKKNWLLLVLLSFFLLVCTFMGLLCLWSLVETMVRREAFSLIVLIPTGFLTIVGILTFKKLMWQWKGAEMIIVRNGQLILRRKSVLNDSLEIYHLWKINDLRVYDDADDFTWGKDTAFKTNSLIRFEYGHETIKFAADISYAEAEYIVELITEKLGIAK